MKTVRPILVTLAIGLVFGVGLWLGLVLPRFPGMTSNLRTYNTATVLKQVQTLSHLVTVKYVMEKVVVTEDVKWFGENRVLLVAHGVVKAGVDLNRLEAGDIRISDRKIYIRLPPPQITDAYLDDKQTFVVERSTGLLRVFDKNLEQAARQNAVDDIQRAARTDGILQDAMERAQLQLRLLLREMGFEEVEVEIR